MKRIAQPEAFTGLDRLRRLETQLASAPAKSGRRRVLVAAIAREARAYRKSLDVEQATATHDPHPRSSLPTSRRHASGSRRSTSGARARP